MHGALTVGENLADLRGLVIALAAYRIAEQQRGVVEPDCTNVFLSYARSWREKRKPQAIAQRLATNPHAPNEFRCNQVVRNIPEFYATFGVQPTDKLFLPEADRVNI